MQVSLQTSRLIRTFLRMYVEVGACVWAFTTNSAPALLALLLLASYHLGALSRRLVDDRTRRQLCIAPYLLLASFILLSLGYHLYDKTLVAVALLFVGFSIPEGELSSFETAQKPSRLAKIFAKLIGMTAPVVLAFSDIAYSALAIILVLVIAFYAAKPATTEREAQSPWRSIDLVNIFHQSGYFAFCFAFWTLIDNLSAPQIALLFPLGWVAYWALELRLSADPNFRSFLLFGGHVLFGVTLLAMFAIPNSTAPILIGWFLTGLFGGTCYTMDHAPGGKPSGLSDDVGALLGSGTGLLAIAATGEPSASLVVGASFAFSAAFAAFHLTVSQTDERKDR